MNDDTGYTPDNDLEKDTSKRLPIVLCLDVSPSMGLNNRMTNLNRAINKLYCALQEDEKARYAAEISIVSFSTNIEEDTNFMRLGCLKGKTFTPVARGGTNTPAAVMRSIEKLENRVREIRSKGVDAYLPFLILVTDGDPDETANPAALKRAADLVVKHCTLDDEDNILIAPYVIGVGSDVREESLRPFVEKFTEEPMLLDDDTENDGCNFETLFLFIANSIKNSMRGNRDLKGLYRQLKKEAKSAKKVIRPKKPILA